MRKILRLKMSFVKLRCKTNFTPDDENNHECFLSFLAFKNFDKYFPLINKKNKSRIMNLLTTKFMFQFLDEINVFNMELNFPDNLIELPFVKKISVDDYNINKIFHAWNLFPSLTELYLETSVDVCLNNDTLKKLSVLNSSNDFKNSPEINCKNLEDLSLMGFSVEFRGKLPKKLKLHTCYVNSSYDLTGCDVMDLTSTIWENPSIPLKELYLDDSDFSTNVLSLKILHITDSKFNSRLSDIVGVEELKYDNGGNPDFESFPDSLTKLICNMSSLPSYSFTKNLRELILKNVGETFTPPDHLEKLTLTNSSLCGKTFSPKTKLSYLKIMYSKLSHYYFNFNTDVLVLYESDFYQAAEITGYDKLAAYDCKNLPDVKQFNTDIFSMTDDDFIKYCGAFANNFSLKINCENDLRSLKLFNPDKHKTFMEIYENF